ncbi:MAG: hypothetical protein A4E49_03344 [Methanosaeta sp. PtaU1.Bin112]|nr:MAG: hypothetical protein A4E49_03344 [Methanosaeta sp. PtaU1.Bin112]
MKKIKASQKMREEAIRQRLKKSLPWSLSRWLARVLRGNTK